MTTPPISTGKNFTRLKDNYKILYKPEYPYSDNKGKVPEHIFIWWLHNKDINYDSKKEVIHHINGNVKDNSIINLKKVTRSEHTFIHSNRGKLYRKLNNNNVYINKYKFIYDSIKDGLNIFKIYNKLQLSKQNIQYYLKLLKNANLIKKVGYGTWEVINEYSEKALNNSIEGKKLTTLGDSNNLDTSRLNNLITEPKIRAHAFQFVLSIPKLNNWNKRQIYLNKKNIQFIPSLIGERLYFHGRKIWLTNKSIVVNEPHDYLVKTALEGKSYAISEFLILIKRLESILNCSLKFANGYQFKVTKAHYADLKNALAKQYRKDNKKLYVYDGRGLWLWADFSYKIDELETGNRQDSDKHMDNIIAPFFNGLKDYKGEVTPKWIVESIGGIVKNQIVFDKNMESHIKAVQALAAGVEEFNKKIDKLKLSKE